MSEIAPTVALLLQAGSSPMGNPLIPVVIMVVIFYLVLFLPMRRRQKKTEEMLKNLKHGDRVVTNGGIIGTIVKVSDNSVHLRVKPDDVKIEFARSAVSGIAAEEQPK